MLESLQIGKMSVTEPLQGMEQIWDTLCCDPAAVASPEWHRDILADRKARAARGEAKFLTLDQLRARLRGSES